MGNALTRSISWLAWTVALGIALAASSASIWCAYRYGVSIAAGSDHPEIAGYALALLDVVKFGLLGLAAASVARGDRGIGRAIHGLLALLVLMSLWAALSVTIIDRAHTDAKATGVSQLETDLRTEMSTAEARIKELGSPKPQAAIEAELDGFKADERWRTTASCTPNSITVPGSRKFCERMALTQSLIAQAAEADGLRTRIAEIRRQLAGLVPEGATPPSPELTMIAAALGVAADTVGLARAVVWALVVELVGAVIPSALWRLRPSTPFASSVPAAKPARVAASRDRAPRAPSPTPATPKRGPLPAARRRGRPPCNHEAISFAEEYTRRHGHPPSISEVARAVTSVSRSTAARALRVVRNGALQNAS